MTKPKTRKDQPNHFFRPVVPKFEQPFAKPTHIKVQVCQSGADDRFAAAPGHVGEFSREWAQRMAAS